MKFWLGVVSSLISYERLSKGEQLWFCLNNDCSEGDVVLLYRTTKTIKPSGIFASYLIRLVDADRNAKCSPYNSLGFGKQLCYVELTPVEVFSYPLDLARIKRVPLLRNSSAVKRSFQGTCFELTASEYKALRNLVIKKT